MKDSDLGIYSTFSENMTIKNLLYSNIENDIKLYFATDLNFLRENRILPFLNNYFKIEDNDVIRYNFHLIIIKIVKLDIDEILIDILKLNYRNFNKKWREIIDFGFTHLVRFYGIFLSTNDYNPNSQINLKNFIKKKYGKKSITDFNNLSKGNYEVSKRRYYIINSKSHYFNKLLLEEISYIRLQTNRNIRNDLDLIKVISARNSIDSKCFSKSGLLFNIEKRKVGGAEKQFHILYNTVNIYFQDAECNVKLTYSEEKPFVFEKYQRASLSDQHKATIRLIKNTTLKKYVFNAAVDQLFYHPSYIVSSMHYCGLGNLIANKIIGRSSYSYIRIGSQPPVNISGLDDRLNKYNLIQNIYELYKDEMSIIVNCDYLKILYQNILPYNRIIKVYNVVDKPNAVVNVDTKTTIMKIGFVGRNTPSKNILNLITLFSELVNNVNVPVEMYIYSDKLLGTPVEELVKKLNLYSKVSLLENEEDPAKIYPTFDLYVSMSTEEGLSNSIMEALSYNIPCISLDAGGSKEIIINNFNGYLCKNSHELYNCLVEMVNDNKKFITFKENIDKFDLKKFSTIQVCNKIKEEVDYQKTILPLGNKEV